MMAAADLAVQLGMLDGGAVDRHRTPLEAAGLPTKVKMDIGATYEVLKQDKKHREGFRFVLLDAIGRPRTGVGATDEQVQAALRSVTE
jgi:3-dehydroquinate synthetase